MKKLVPALLAVSLTLLFPLSSRADEVASLKFGYQMLHPSGNFTASDGGAGTRIDLQDDLDLGDSEELAAEAALQFGSFRLSAAYLPLSFSGSNTLTRTVFFNGQPYTAGEEVRGKVDADLYDVGLAWYLLNFDDLPVRLQLGAEVAVKVLDADLSVESRTSGLKEEVSGTAAIPTAGARARLGLADWVGLVGRVGYAEYDGNSFLDADGQIEFSPLPMLGIFAGYRYLDAEVDTSDLLLDARLEGPYGGAFLRF